MFCLGDFTSDLLAAESVKSVMNNPIYTAMLIVITMMVIFYFMFRSRIDDEPFWPTFIRAGIYGLILVTAIIFLHYRVSELTRESSGEVRILDKVVQGAMEKNISGDENEILLHQLKLMTPDVPATKRDITLAGSSAFKTAAEKPALVTTGVVQSAVIDEAKV